MVRSRPLGAFVAYMTWLALVLRVAPTMAQAEPQPSEATTPAYDGFIDQALQAYDSGRFAEARTLFRRAHELRPTARTLRTIGMCAFNLGDYVDAVVSLEAALAEARMPLTEEQRSHANDLIARSHQHVGRFRVQLSPADAVLSVDHRAPTLTAQRELVLEAGRHEIDVRAMGYQSGQSVLNVAGGDRTTFELRLVPTPDSQMTRAVAAPERQTRPAVSHAPAEPLPVAPADTRRASFQTTLGYVTLGTGFAGLAAFGVVGALAVARQSQLSDDCPNGQCPPAYHGDVDSYDTLRAVSTGLVIGGGACALLGAGLLLFAQPARADRGISARADRATPSRADRATLEPVFGVASIGLRGRL